MNDPKSTNDVRMIAQDVTRTQAEICEARRGRLDDRQAVLVAATAANARAVAALSEAVAALTVTVTQLASTVATQAATDAAQAATNATQEVRLGKLETQQAVMAVKLARAAVAGSVVGGSLPYVVEWIIQAVNH